MASKYTFYVFNNLKYQGNTSWNCFKKKNSADLIKMATITERKDGMWRRRSLVHCWQASQRLQPEYGNQCAGSSKIYSMTVIWHAWVQRTPSAVMGALVHPSVLPYHSTRRWSQSRHPSADGWTQEMWVTGARTFLHSNKNEVMRFPGKWGN